MTPQDYAITLKAETRSGADIRKTAEALWKLTRLVQVPVETDFNGTLMFAYPNDTPDTILERWKEWRKVTV